MAGASLRSPRLAAHTIPALHCLTIAAVAHLRAEPAVLRTRRYWPRARRTKPSWPAWQLNGQRGLRRPAVAPGRRGVPLGGPHARRWVMVPAQETAAAVAGTEIPPAWDRLPQRRLVPTLLLMPTSGRCLTWPDSRAKQARVALSDERLLA